MKGGEVFLPTLLIYMQSMTKGRFFCHKIPSQKDTPDTIAHETSTTKLHHQRR